MARVQVTIGGKAEKIWSLLSRMGKSKAIEQAIIILAQDKTLAPIFFEDMNKVEAILNGKDKNFTSKEPSVSVETQASISKPLSTKDDNGQIETVWD